MKNIKTLLIIFVALFIFMPTNTKAAPANIEFSSGGKINEDTYVYAGNNGTDGSVIMKKLDGTVLWRKDYLNLKINALTVTAEGKIVVVAKKKIIVFDESGSVVWEKDVTENLQAIVAEDDGGFTAAGLINDGVIVRYDKDGNVLDEGVLHGKNGANFRAIDKTDDGGYIVAGLTYSSDLGIGSTCTSIIAKYDKDLNLLWNTFWGGNYSDEYSGVATDKDGNYLAVGRTFSSEKLQFSTDGSSDAVIVKYDKDGNVIWEKIYGGTKNDRFKAINVDENGITLVAGFSKSPEIIENSGYDSILYEIDKDGNVVKEDVLGTNSGDEAYGFIKMSDSVIVLLGLFPEENEYIKDGSMVFKKSFKVTLETTYTTGVELSSDTVRFEDEVEVLIDSSIADKVVVKIYNASTNKEITSLVKYDDTTNKFVMPDYDVKVVVSEGIIPPPTGDNVLTYMILALISVVAITSILIFSKKETKK